MNGSALPAIELSLVDRTIALINAIGTATLDKASAIAEARAALEESAAAMVFTAAEEAEGSGYRVTAYVKSTKGEPPALTVMICTYDENQKFQSCVLLPVETVKEGQTASVGTICNGRQ